MTPRGKLSAKHSSWEMLHDKYIVYQSTMEKLANQVLENQKDADAKVNFVPARFEKTLTQWMENCY